MSFEEMYPNIAKFTLCQGRVEFGYDDYDPAFVRAVDPGGNVWESDQLYDSLDKMLQELDAALGKWMEEMGLDDC